MWHAHNGLPLFRAAFLRFEMVIKKTVKSLASAINVEHDPQKIKNDIFNRFKVKDLL